MKFPEFEQVVAGNLYSISNRRYIGYTYRHKILNNFFIQIQCINSMSVSRCDKIEFSLCNNAGISIWSESYECEKDSYRYGCDQLIKIMATIAQTFNDIILNNRE